MRGERGIDIMVEREREREREEVHIMLRGNTRVTHILV